MVIHHMRVNHSHESTENYKTRQKRIYIYKANCILTSRNIPRLFQNNHDDLIKWKHFPRYWRFVRGIHRSPVNSPHKAPVTRKMFPFDEVIMIILKQSPHKGQWRGALIFSLICVCINAWINNREAGYLRQHRAHYDVIVMILYNLKLSPF